MTLIYFTLAVLALVIGRLIVKSRVKYAWLRVIPIAVVCAALIGINVFSSSEDEVDHSPKVTLSSESAEASETKTVSTPEPEQEPAINAVPAAKQEETKAEKSPKEKLLAARDKCLSDVGACDEYFKALDDYYFGNARKFGEAGDRESLNELMGWTLEACKMDDFASCTQALTLGRLHDMDVHDQAYTTMTERCEDPAIEENGENAYCSFLAMVALEDGRYIRGYGLAVDGCNKNNIESCFIKAAYLIYNKDIEGLSKTLEKICILHSRFGGEFRDPDDICESMKRSEMVTREMIPSIKKLTIRFPRAKKAVTLGDILALRQK